MKIVNVDSANGEWSRMRLSLTLIVFSILSPFLSFGQQPNVAERVFERCWADADAMKLLDEPTCHLAWISQLKSAPVVAIDYASPLGGDHDGAFRLVLGGGLHAMFKPCATRKGTVDWHRELIAYHIDRALQIHRAPASVVRRFSWRELLATRPFGAIRDILLKVQAQCSDPEYPDHVIGLLQGWTRFDVKLLDRVDLAFANETWFPRTPTSQQIEFSRLMMSLYINGIESDLFGRVAELDEPDATVPGYRTNDGREPHRLLMAIDRGHASWSPVKDVEPSVREQVCSRSHDDMQFRCLLHAQPSDAPEVLAGRVMSFLRTACIFPSDVTARVKEFGQQYAAKLSGHLIEDVRKAGLDLSKATVQGWSAEVLDARLTKMSDVIDTCVRLFGSIQVVFQSTAYRNV